MLVFLLERNDDKRGKVTILSIVYARFQGCYKIVLNWQYMQSEACPQWAQGLLLDSWENQKKSSKLDFAKITLCACLQYTGNMENQAMIFIQADFGSYYVLLLKKKRPHAYTDMHFPSDSFAALPKLTFQQPG